MGFRRFVINLTVVVMAAGTAGATGILYPPSKVRNAGIFLAVAMVAATIAVAVVIVVVTLGRGRVPKVLGIVAAAGLVVPALRGVSTDDITDTHHAVYPLGTCLWIRLYRLTVAAAINEGHHRLVSCRQARIANTVGAVSSHQAVTISEGRFGHGMYARIDRRHAHVGNAGGAGGWIVGIRSAALLYFVMGVGGTGSFGFFHVFQVAGVFGTLVNGQESLQ